MTVIDYALFILATLALAAVLDTLWLNHVRPALAASYGWPDVADDERVPAAAWAGAALFIIVLFVLLPAFGVAAGY